MFPENTKYTVEIYQVHKKQDDNRKNTFVDIFTTGYFSDHIHPETFSTCLTIAKALEHPCKTGEYIPQGGIRKQEWAEGVGR